MSPESTTEEWKDKPKATGFWHTFPGIITAIAGLLTAMAGLILALHQVGLLGNNKESASVNNPVNTSSPLASDKASDASRPGSITNATENKADGTSPNIPVYEVSFPEGRTVTLTHWSEGTYTVLNSQADQLSKEKLKLTLTFRLTNKGKLDLNFWDSTFRLLIDDVPRAPISNLNVVVAGRSAKEGDVIFEVPVTAQKLVLQLSNSKESIDIPLVIKRVN